MKGIPVQAMRYKPKAATAADTMHSIFFACVARASCPCSRPGRPCHVSARQVRTSVTLSILMTGREEATMNAARPAVASKAKRPLPPRQGKGRGVNIATPKAVNVSARRNGCANNPVEPAAIQAAARPAVAAIKGPSASDTATGQSGINSSDFL